MRNNNSILSLENILVFHQENIEIYILLKKTALRDFTNELKNDVEV